MSAQATNTPSKVQRLLDIAARYSELITAEVEDPSGATDVRSWTIKANPEVRPHETTQIWVYWTPGRNGGRIHIARYTPGRSRFGRNRKDTQQLTRNSAAIWIAMSAGH